MAEEELNQWSDITFPSKEIMMEKFKQNDTMNYFIEKGIVQSLINKTADETMKVIGLEILMECIFYDFEDVFKGNPEMTNFLYKNSLKNALIQSAK